MARINIEEDLFADLKFIKLVMSLNGSREMAIGCLFWAWRLSQQYYLINGGWISKEKWKTELINDLVFEVGFFEENEDGSRRPINVDKHFSWLKQRSNAGKQRYQSKYHQKSDKKDQVLKSLKNQDNDRQRTLTPVNGGQPPTLPLSLSLLKNKNIDQFDFESLYQKYPRKIGKQKGLLIAKRQIKTSDQFSQLSAAIDRYIIYCKGKDPEYIKHFSTFMESWTDWTEQDAGKVINSREELKTKEEKDPWLEEIKRKMKEL